MRKLFFVFPMLAVLAGCSKDMSDMPADPASEIVFKASVEKTEYATKTYIERTGESVSMYWTGGDSISLFGAGNNEKYIFLGNTGDTGGDFASAGIASTGLAFRPNRFYAVYPYAASTGMPSDGTFTYNLPATQTYAEGSFGIGAGVMTAVTSSLTDHALPFKHVMGFLELRVYGSKAVQSIVFAGNNAEPLTGTATITASYGQDPVITLPSDGGKTITLACGSVAIGTEASSATSFYLAIPPTTFSQGFTVTVTDVDGKATVKSTDKSVAIVRNVIQPMEAFQLESTGDSGDPSDPNNPGNPEDPLTPVIPELPTVTGTLPVLYVYTPGNVGVTDKETWITESHFYLKYADGTAEDLGTGGIKGRGNTTWNFDKKPYAIKLDTKAGLLGMPKDKRWNLLANYVDRTRIRNEIALELGRRATGLDWTPKGKFVELVLNGTHMGNYYLVEHIKVAKNRVNITEMTAEDIAEPAITGGYLIECSTEMDEVNKFYTNYFADSYPYNSGLHNNGQFRLPVMIKSPDEDVMVADQLTWIKNFMNSVQSRIVNNNATWLNDVDMDSFIDWMLVQEVVGNYEPFHPKSSYMHKDREGKLMMGPLWDFDYGTFRADYASTPIYHYAIWYPHMLKNATFKARVKERWPIVRSAFSGVVNYVDEVAAEVKASVERDWAMWPTTNNINGDINKTFDEAVSSLKSNLQRRINQMGTEVSNM